jgi:ubiquinone/menaquinone biosynthesis C-methylase UbiE
MINNRGVYESPFAIRHFVQLAKLFPPELSILQKVREELSHASMLDIGVGGGRTTLHFAPVARQYTAIDYSIAMITACRKRFPAHRVLFGAADARALPFRDRSFQFVLFSYNGIDYVSHDDRLRILDEVRRVLEPGGRYAFSSHNLVAAPSFLVKGRLPDPRLTLLRQQLRRRNPPLRTIASASHALLRDGALRGRLVTYYARRDEHLRQLTNAGFSVLEVLQLDGTAAGADTTDSWLYYLCRRE